MVKLLRIDNFVLIDRVELLLDKGFTVITGETGSGKSILLNAINLLLGERADFSVIGKKSNKSFVEASFEMEARFIDFFTTHDLDQNSEIIVRREIVKDGKSRAFINDTPVQLTVLKELTSQLLSVNSQFNTYDLRSNQYQMELFDDMANTSLLRKKYTKNYLNWKSSNLLLSKLEEKRTELLKQNDYNQFLLEELAQLDLLNTDFSEFESVLKRIENADFIRDIAIQLSNFSEENGPYAVLNSVLFKLEKVGDVDPKMKQFQGQLKAILIELKELMNEAENLVNGLEVDPEEQQKILKKVDEYNRQLSKHRFSNQSQLVELWTKLSHNSLDNKLLDEEIHVLMTENKTLYASLQLNAKELHEKRIAAASTLEELLQKILMELKLMETKLSFDLLATDTLKENGNSELKILFSANKGMSMVPIEKAASGGEMSRVMLALQKIISEKRKLPTILFDEIDTGVSGDVAEKIGILLRNMGENLQLIAITHLPQVSAKANHHFKVEKDTDDNGSQTHVKRLKSDEIAIEIARLMSGEIITTEAILTAKNLMN
jgi:DNA repair protein RecN (Recombination protein N)